ncbi:MAG: energy transducer TonB [Pseudomonadota bacterium]
MTKDTLRVATAILALTAAVFLGMTAGSTAAAEPAVVKAVAPDYPRAAERRDLEGYVIVSIDVDSDGNVTKVSVIDADNPGIFDSAAMRAVERWKFSSGDPVTGMKKKIVFQLQN